MDSSKRGDADDLDEIISLRERIQSLEAEIRRLESVNTGVTGSSAFSELNDGVAVFESLALRSSPIPAFLLDMQGHMLFTNPAFDHVFRQSGAETKDRSIEQVFPEEICERIREAEWEAAEFGVSEQYEWEWEIVDKLRVFNMLLYPILDKDAVCTAIGGLIIDTTEQNRSNQRLAESEQRFRSLIEKADNLVVQLDRNYRIEFANQAALRLFGMTETHCIGLNMLDFVHVEDSDRIERCFNECISSGKLHLTQESRLPQSDGGVRYLLWSYQFIYNEMGRLVSINGIAQDITQRRSLENQMMKAKENAEAADRSKSEFLAMISHEIRTPLNSIIGLSDLLHQSKFSEEEKMMLETISSSGQSLLNLINDVLDLSKVEAGHITLNKEEINLRDSLTQINNLFLFRAKTKGIDLIWEIDQSVPKTILADRERFIQVLNNLVGNAIKFTNEGYVKVHVKADVLTNVEELDLWSDDEGEHLRPYRLKFDVEDTGIGIKQEQRILLFQPFSQADSSIRRRFGGTGLGLVVSRKLAKLMNGDIDLTSEYGRGSTFSFSMQVDGRYADPAVGDKHTTSLKHNRKVDSKLAERYPMRIMVVDDISHNRLVMNMLLKKMGYDPVVLSSGQESIDYLADQGVDLIFMDMVMPEMSGMEAVEVIRSQQASGAVDAQRIRIVALTANAMEQDREECLEAGMDDFVTKPIRFSSIQKCICDTAEQMKNRSADEMEYDLF